MVNSPHNPTGSILSDDELRLLHDFAAERGIQFVVDEVYHPIYHDGETMSASRLPHATVLGDMSKAMCLSGLRVGWIIDRDPARRDRYFDARTYFTISNTPLGEALASIALNRRETILARAREITGKNLALLDQFMESHRETIEWVRPRGGMTAFPWLAREQDSRPFCRQLAAGGVLFAPGDCFGAPQHFRLGFGASGTRFEAALERLETFLETYSPAAKD
jgi:aspartate/methionine/tyrosine aminotransferase